jgi:branched-chain amino acid transport system substrate-binding protein
MGAVCALSVALAAPAFADTIKVGVIAPFSGPFAIWGKQFKEATEVYVAQHGNKVGEHTIEFIYRDSGGPNPDAAKSLAQELLIKDQVDYLGGFVFTPNALAVAPLIQKAKKPAVIYNAATSIITTKSDYFVRTGFTLWQVSVPMANWAWDNGIKTVVTAVTDYGPGIDGENAFKTAFEKKGGKVIDSIRMPIQTTDFAPFMQRIKDQAPDAVFGFLPAGPPTFAFTKSYNENALREGGIEFMGTGETDETTLEALGDAALGLTTAYHYAGSHDSELNKTFTGKLTEMFPGAVANLASVGAYDGVHIIYKMVEAAGKDGTKAVEAAKGMAWESPRGPVSIDPETRHITQNVYLRKVDKDANGVLINREFETIEAVPDLGLQNQ